MVKILEKIKAFFKGKLKCCAKDKGPGAEQQEEPKAEQRPEEYK